MGKLRKRKQIETVDAVDAVDAAVMGLQEQYPYGHPAFVGKVVDELALHSNKNHDYAAGGDPLGNFKRVATILSLYPDLDNSNPAVVPLLFSLKQLDAVLWGLNQGIVHKVEGPVGRLQDISVYAKITQIILEEQDPAFNTTTL